MCSLSNTLIGLLNILTVFISIPIIGFALYLREQGSTDCEKFLEIPALYFGVFLLVVSVLGLIGSFCRVSFCLWIYLFVMFLLLIALFCFTIFAFVVTNKGVGAVVSGKGYKEYRLGDYSHWLQKQVGNAKHWEKIKSCLNDAEVCSSLGKYGGQTASEFYQSNLSPIQSGCCKPPTYCGFTYKNATFWMAPKSGMIAGDSDCKTWSNDQDRLCYDCKSCKAGVLANLKNNWKKIAKVNVILLIFLMCVYSVGCCAFRNSSSYTYKRYRR